MEAYRDQYARLFNNGHDVVVLGISVDPDTTLENWFRQSDFPIMAMSDSGATVSRMYEALNEKSGIDNRHLYVIDPSGRVSFKMLPFHVLSQPDYDALAEAVGKVLPKPKEGAE
jgi:peroxiredoxin